jgi:hypothetical protein
MPTDLEVVLTDEPDQLHTLGQARVEESSTCSSTTRSLGGRRLR